MLTDVSRVLRQLQGGQETAAARAPPHARPAPPPVRAMPRAGSAAVADGPEELGSVLSLSLCQYSALSFSLCWPVTSSRGAPAVSWQVRTSVTH